MFDQWISKFRSAEATAICRLPNECDSYSECATYGLRLEDLELRLSCHLAAEFLGCAYIYTLSAFTPEEQARASMSFDSLSDRAQAIALMETYDAVREKIEGYTQKITQKRIQRMTREERAKSAKKLVALLSRNL